jgi:flagellar hook-length control protein FliK
VYGIAHLVATDGIEPARYGEFSLQSYQEPERSFEEYLIAAQSPDRYDRDALPVIRQPVSNERPLPPGNESATEERAHRDAIRRNEEQIRASNDANAARDSSSRADSGRELEKKENAETRLSKRKTDELKKPVATQENDNDEDRNVAVTDAAAIIRDAKDEIRNSTTGSGAEGGATEAGAARERESAGEKGAGVGEHGKTGTDEQAGKVGRTEKVEKAEKAEKAEEAEEAEEAKKADQAAKSGRVENRDVDKDSPGKTDSESSSPAGNAAHKDSIGDDMRGESGGASSPSTDKASEVKNDSGETPIRESAGDAAQSARNTTFRDGIRGDATGEVTAEAAGKQQDTKRRAAVAGERAGSENEKDGTVVQVRRGRTVAPTHRGENSDTRNGGSDDNDRIVREITVDLLDDADSAPEDSSQQSFRDLMSRLDGTSSGGEHRTAPSPTADAAQQLARRLNGTLGDSIVRQAQVIMKDADSGEIRLIIRPPELGRVRIQLQMDQGHIAGRILVDNQNVRQAIEQNLASLQRAFADAGLEMGELEVGTGDARNQSGDDRSGAGDSEHARGSERRAEQFGRSVKVTPEYDYGNRRVNLVA